MKIEMALKSRSYILDLDCGKLSLEIFFFLSCLMDSFFYQLSGSTFIFVNNTHQKAANLMFPLILPVAKVPWLFLEVQYMVFRLLCFLSKGGVGLKDWSITIKFPPF